ncbi:hypothetical protein [uncultured Paraglaciecola sp.]|uniref:hypothetical protein n=1 Tax=uncultured Paraglaciecola sp. TaxID=1765024 RepID=UPI002606070A|nr:hypothetical protein [uncultured Paraglaciecola sp.]
MTIEQAAREILRLCEAGPIPGGVSIKIQEQAQGIVDAFEWVDCSDRLPEDENLKRVRYSDGSEGNDWFEACGTTEYDRRWQSIFSQPTSWRRIL